MLLNALGAVDAAANSGEEGSLADLGTDGLEYFGISQDAFAESQSESRDERVRRREEKKGSGGASASTKTANPSNKPAARAPSGSSSSSSARRTTVCATTHGESDRLCLRYM
jgi:hypothetical protein